MITIYANQPRLYPYIHYLRAMRISDITDLGIHDPFAEGYVHRVHIGYDNAKEWWRIPIEGGMRGNSGKDISSVLIDRKNLQLNSGCIQQLKRMYDGFSCWKVYSDDVISLLFDHRFLWEALVSATEWLNNVLSLDCIISLGRPSTGNDVTSRIASQLGRYGAKNTYLAGESSKNYLDSSKYFQLTGQLVSYYRKDTVFNNFDTVSILTPLFMYGRQYIVDLLSESLTKVVEK